MRTWIISGRSNRIENEHFKVRREHRTERDQTIKWFLSYGWSYRQIAVELNCSVGTIANAQRRLKEQQGTAEDRE